MGGFGVISHSLSVLLKGGLLMQNEWSCVFLVSLVLGEEFGYVWLHKMVRVSAFVEKGGSGCWDSV